VLEPAGRARGILEGRRHGRLSVRNWRLFSQVLSPSWLLVVSVPPSLVSAIQSETRVCDAAPVFPHLWHESIASIPSSLSRPSEQRRTHSAVKDASLDWTRASTTTLVGAASFWLRIMR
jgi:hypothetical protein